MVLCQSTYLWLTQFVGTLECANTVVDFSCFNQNQLARMKSGDSLLLLTPLKECIGWYMTLTSRKVSAAEKLVSYYGWHPRRIFLKCPQVIEWWMEFAYHACIFPCQSRAFKQAVILCVLSLLCLFFSLQISQEDRATASFLLPYSPLNLSKRDRKLHAGGN